MSLLKRTPSCFCYTSNIPQFKKSDKKIKKKLLNYSYWLTDCMASPLSLMGYGSWWQLAVILLDCQKVLDVDTHTHTHTHTHYKKQFSGVPAVARWVRDPACLCGGAVSIPGLAWWVKDPVLLQLWHRLQFWLEFDPWPGNFHMLEKKKPFSKHLLCMGCWDIGMSSAWILDLKASHS